MNRTATLFGCIVTVTTPTLAQAQAFPTKPVRLVVGSAPGSGNDIAARVVAARVSEAWGQQIVIENRSGANQMIGADIVAHATPDGYTLLLCGTVTVAINPTLYRRTGDSKTRDFAPVTLIASSPNVLIVHPATPARTAKEFVAYVSLHPGKFNYGSSGVGSTLHLSMEMLATATGIRMQHVPYKGGALAMADLMGGHLLAVFQNVPVALSSIRAGRVRAVGVTAAARSPQLPDVPTFAEAGYPGLEIAAWYGVCAPAATPLPVLTRINEAMVRALELPDERERFAEMGIEPAPLTIRAFGAFIRAEIAKWAKAVKDSGAVAP